MLLWPGQWLSLAVVSLSVAVHQPWPLELSGASQGKAGQWGLGDLGARPPSMQAKLPRAKVAGQNNLAMFLQSLEPQKWAASLQVHKPGKGSVAVKPQPSAPGPPGLHTAVDDGQPQALATELSEGSRWPCISQEGTLLRPSQCPRQTPPCAVNQAQAGAFQSHEHQTAKHAMGSLGNEELG